VGALPLLDPGQEPDETLTALHKAVVDSAYDVINLKVGSVLWFVVGFVSLFQAACSLLVAFFFVCILLSLRTGIYQLGHWHVNRLHCKGGTKRHSYYCSRVDLCPWFVWR
jgi:hypothetical protein